MRFFDEYFVFSDSEKKGVLFFVLILLAMTSFYWIIPHVFTSSSQDFSLIADKIQEMEEDASHIDSLPLRFSFNPNTVSKDSLLLLGMTSKQADNVINYREKIGGFAVKGDFKKLYSISDSLYTVMKPLLDLPSKTRKSIVEKETSLLKQDSFFLFNPNTESLEGLVSLGLSERQSRILINYREKGGKFKVKEDLKKIYSISEETYSTLEPYIFLPEEQVQQVATAKLKINSASPFEIQKSIGVSKKRSYTLVNYRKKLGGFYSVTQLYEVYGIDSTIIQLNELNVEVDPSEIRQLNINTSTFKELVSHPYFSYSDVKKLINFREMHGDFVAVQQILENNLINLKQYRKIVPYLTIE